MALFKTTAELRNFLKIDINTNFSVISPVLEEAEQEYIVPLLGQDFYDVIHAAYTGDTLSADQLALLPYIQKALAHYYAYSAVDELLVSVGSGGINQMRGNDAEPAPRWKVEKLQRSYIQKADKFAEKLLEYLEDNASATKYNEWYSDSAANTRNEGYMVYSTRIASKYLDIADSRRIFLRMKKRVRDIEPAEAMLLIGAGQYDELVTQIKTDAITDANLKLIDKLVPVISKMAFYETIPSLRLVIDDRGISLLSSNDSVVSKMTASKEDIKDLKHNLKSGRTGWESDEAVLYKFITDNIDTYPLIKESGVYTARPAEGVVHTIENKSTNKYFVA
jgi:hypothetical protein